MNAMIEMLQKRGIKAVLFDKDGTLLDFEKTWRPMLEHFGKVLVEEFHLTEEQQASLLHRLGVDQNGYQPNSVFVKDHLEEIVQTAVSDPLLTMKQSQGLEQFLRAFLATDETNKIVKPHMFESVPQVLSNLKHQGFLLGVVTSDMEETAQGHLDVLELTPYIDFLAGDNGTRPVKPHRAVLDEFCETFGVQAQDVAMVGDSMNDMRFAVDNGMGCAIFVQSCYPDDDAQNLADFVFSGVGDFL